MAQEDSGAEPKSSAYYVYALLDPRQSPPRPFYIGKGVGSRKYHHANEEGDSAKQERIRQIKEAGLKPDEMTLVSGLSEQDAYRVELQLISAYGLETKGGLLTNAVQPATIKRSTGSVAKARPGAEERVQMALGIIKDEIVAMAELNPAGISNADVANKLGLQSSHSGGQINQLSYGLLGLLMLEQRIIKPPDEPKYWSPRNFIDRQKP